ncbi:hypothetical protein CWE12_06230 [Aliidiomarina sedimenti]|uniref:DUF5808 domain-containing protein n=1 Tax=Aliidiomarina sedimenti TaxID=1933879 RepID=A0ABY0C074_9GAMM|nr:DUF5808 domain-containing protein [Aliidiomarina sedimenti]RUO30832.1 hypothetical protein CWE12_06230 [Aliidiomarina sedimenti]
MSQEEINQNEWKRSENWSRPRWLGLYFSKKDTRSWVPKQVPALGWTLNLGQPKGALWAVTLVVAAILIGVVAGWWTGSQ